MENKGQRQRTDVVDTIRDLAGTQTLHGLVLDKICDGSFTVELAIWGIKMEAMKNQHRKICI